MLYGIKPASGIFQKLIENHLKDVPKTVVEIDDILISGSSDDEHFENLQRVFEILENLGLL